MKRFIVAGILGMAAVCRGGIDEERLADAIGKAENSKSHPYGILTTYKHTTPRQACLNTIRTALTRWRAAGEPGEFIPWLGRTYCPIVGAKNDPHKLNQNWVRNVSHFYTLSTGS